MSTVHEFIISVTVAKPEDIEEIYDAIGDCENVMEFAEMADWNIAEEEAREAARAVEREAERAEKQARKAARALAK
jgi:hypothetical protein